MQPLAYLVALERAADLRREASRIRAGSTPQRTRFRVPERLRTQVQVWSRRAA